VTEGYIIWDANANRPDIKYDDNTYYGGLHCGNTLEALICDKWMPTRIEYSHSAKAWYLVGIENSYDILWLTVRI
jgi:hypothetical protein